jgi:hypothetical protein
MGAGHVQPGRPQNKGSAFQPGLVYDADLFDYVGSLCDASPSSLVLLTSNPAGLCEALEDDGVAVKAYDLNLPSIAVGQLPGVQTVTRTVTSVAKDNGNRKYEVSVNAPPGFSVEVSPSSFSLKSGESATYRVTIRNESAPLGQFRFGSLTWTENSGQYKSFSPIAVRASAFLAPTQVEGEGVSGSAQIQVRFGYTGNYNAVPHGLVPATVTQDNVLQDADQTFQPTDVASGAANAHVIAVANADFLRIELPPEATEANADLDIYLFNPSNALAATSTNPGTEETITIPTPANGNWTWFVHGWSAPGGDSDYDLFSWVVPSATGGTLEVDSAPASAVNGTVGTVNVSWTGATSGQWHLGSVTHHRDGALLGRTVVEVDNR